MIILGPGVYSAPPEMSYESLIRAYNNMEFEQDTPTSRAYLDDLKRQILNLQKEYGFPPAVLKVFFASPIKPLDI